MFGSVKLKDITLLPNLITISRIIILPFFIYSLSEGEKSFWYTIGLFLVIILTDFLDGYISRKFNLGSDLGKLLDPLSDKVVTLGIAISLVAYKGFPLWFLITLVSKDIALMIGGLWLYYKKGIVVKANIWGKITTTILAILVCIYLLQNYLPFTPEIPLLISLLVVAITAIIYSANFITKVKSKNE